MPDFLYQWPLWIAFTLLVLFFVGFSQLTLLLVRRFFAPRLQFGEHDGHFGAAMIHSMMVFYGLVAALLAINVYETYSDVSKTVSREVAAISALYRDASGYPEPVRTQVQNRIREYTRQIIDEAWPQQRRGEIPSGGVAYVTRIQDRLFTFEPASQGQAIRHAQALQQYNELALARRLRVDANRERLPDIMWRLLIFGGLLCLFVACFFDVNTFWLHAFALAMVSVLISTVLFMTFAWDRPYVGEFGVDSEAYELLYEQLLNH